MKKMIHTKLCSILSSKIMSQTREEVPVIIQLNESSSVSSDDIKSLSTKLKLELPLINGYAGNMNTETIYKLVASSDIEYISFDSKVYALLDIATPTIETNFPHKRGYEGEGITIAVIDTGVVAHHDLTRPTNRIVEFVDLVNGKDKPYDDNGHGTHVTGIIAGNGYSSNKKYVGAAPKANILSIKALDESGGGSISDIIQAISYAIETKDKYNTKIINLSLGTPANSSSNRDPLSRAVEKATKAGLVVVTAAGNSGPEPKTILSPGISKYAITVGAVDDKQTIDTSDDTIAPFSSRGPTLEGLKKPDIVAPGVNIDSLSNESVDKYVSLSGTSMATPLVSGSIALLLNKEKDLSPSQVKKRLMTSTLDLERSWQEQGAGMLNLKELFEDEEEIKEDTDAENNLKNKKPGLLDGDLFETILVIAIVIFLLDSRI